MTASRAGAGGVAVAHGEIKSIKDLAGKKVASSAPGSSTRFLPEISLEEKRPRPGQRAVIGVGLGATRCGDGAGPDRCCVMLDPAVTVLQASHPDLKILSDTRNAKRHARVFGRRISGGALYSTAAWSPRTRKVQALTNAIVTRGPGFIRIRRKKTWRKMPEEMSARTGASISRR